MINFFICFHTQWKFFIQIKFHPGMKFYSFHPGMKLTCKQIFFHHGTSFILGWEFVSVTCKRTLNGLNDKTHRTVIGNEYLMFAFGSKSIALRQSKKLILKGLRFKRLTILGDLIFSGVERVGWLSAAWHLGCDTHMMSTFSGG